MCVCVCVCVFGFMNNPKYKCVCVGGGGEWAGERHEVALRQWEYKIFFFKKTCLFRYIENFTTNKGKFFR